LAPVGTTQVLPPSAPGKQRAGKVQAGPSTGSQPAPSGFKLAALKSDLKQLVG
jgi:hypothetical protein